MRQRAPKVKCCDTKTALLYIQYTLCKERSLPLSGAHLQSPVLGLRAAAADKSAYNVNL